MFNLNSLLLFSENPKKLIGFYEEVLTKKPKWSGGDFYAFQVGDGWLIIGPHDKISGKSKQPERMIINFETKNIKDEFKRISKIAKVVAKPYHPTEEYMTIATFADPDGNFFQITTPVF